MNGGLRMGFSDRDILVELEEGYCQDCGRKARVKAIKRPSEDYDPPGKQGRLVTDYVSECCEAELSLHPVTDQCRVCGEVAAMGSSFARVAGDVMCPGCLADYRQDHPDPEEEAAKAEWYRDTGAFGMPER